MSRIVILAALLIATLSITACGGPGAQQGSGKGSSGAEQASDFSVTTLEGDEFRLADKRGEVVALFFMAGY